MASRRGDPYHEAPRRETPPRSVTPPRANPNLPPAPYPRQGWPRGTVIGCGVALLALAGIIAVLLFADTSCRNEVVADVTSPDEKWHAVVFARDCNDEGEPTTQVSILPSWRSVRRSGNVFAADGDDGRAPAGPG